jgi:hypothetical protein
MIRTSHKQRGGGHPVIFKFFLGGGGRGARGAGIFKLLRSPTIVSKESIPPAYVAWRPGTTTLFLFLAPIDCSKIPALGREQVGFSQGTLAHFHPYSTEQRLCPSQESTVHLSLYGVLTN